MSMKAPSYSRLPIMRGARSIRLSTLASQRPFPSRVGMPRCVHSSAMAHTALPWSTALAAWSSLAASSSTSWR